MAGRPDDTEAENALMALVFEWDETKAKANLAKHGVAFEEAKTIFNDPHLVTFEDRYHSQHEQRYLSIGFSSAGRLLLVAHTDRDEIIRLITGRKATSSERRTYEAPA